MKKFYEKLGMIIVGIIAIAGLGVLVAFPIKWCWNYVMPYLFELKTITWGQAWCINFLAGIVIKASHQQNSKGE